VLGILPDVEPGILRGGCSDTNLTTTDAWGQDAPGCGNQNGRRYTDNSEVHRRWTGGGLLRP
jgi:hypothetical protein